MTNQERGANQSVKRGLCGICPAGCWVRITLDSDGKIVEVDADQESEMGMICNLGKHSPEIVYSPDRLLYPMKRKGPKGSYDFERITWDEAMGTITTRLLEQKEMYGPEAAAIYTGRGSFELAQCDVFQPEGVEVSSASSVLFPYGSPNTLGVGALCYVAFAMIAPHVTMGGMLSNMYSDIENAQLIVVWGANPATDSPPLDFARLMKARERGAEVIVIDPRRTGTARYSDARWIPIRPGTDGALALGICNRLIEQEIYDESLVEDWTVGFEEFARYVGHFRPEVVEGITGTPSETVIELAEKISSAAGAAPLMYSGLEYSEGGVQSIRAVMVLWALAGQLDTPGGRCFSLKENMFPMNRSCHAPNPDTKKALGRDRFPIYSQYRGESHAIALPESVLEGKPYKIRSLIIEGGSIITSWPEPDIWKNTLGNLDFLVCIDRFLTADAAYADIVLPATTYYEIESYMRYGSVFRIREKIIEPLGEARHGFHILADLANRLGYPNLYPQTEEEIVKYGAAAAGFDPEEVRKAGGYVSVPSSMNQYRKWEKGLLRSDGKQGFETPSGKLEIWSSIFEEHGHRPLPEYTEPSESPVSRPDLIDDFPLVFMSGSRVTTDFRSQFHNIPGLLKDNPEPTVMLNSQDANKRGISAGDKVKVATPRGEVLFTAQVTDNIMPGVVDAAMGGGGPIGPEAWRKSNVNELTDLGKYDPISGFPVYKALLCEVTRLEKGQNSETIPPPEARIPGLKQQDFKSTKGASFRRIYLDNNATTPIAPQVLEVMTKHLAESAGNPSSIHSPGNEARSVIEGARRKCASLLNCTARRIVFTGGGSESDNLAIKGVALANMDKGDHIITSSIEHPAVLASCAWLESRGFQITCLPVNRNGIVDPADLESAITDSTILVSVMAANNETGAIQPLNALSRVAREAGAIFHTDAVQAVGKIPLDVDQMGVDLLTLSAHKFHGPKGVGALYIRKGIPIEPLVHGGKQEHGLRAGTEDTAAIAGLGKASELAVIGLQGMDAVEALRDRLEQGIRTLVNAARLNGPKENRLPNTLNITLPGFRGESVVLALDTKGIALSSGSACRSGSPDPSHALLAMGMSPQDAHCALRFSLGAGVTLEDIEITLDMLETVIKESSEGLKFTTCR
jgi:cysteine desulfurase NifS